MPTVGIVCSHKNRATLYGERSISLDTISYFIRLLAAFFHNNLKSERTQSGWQEPNKNNNCGI